MEWYKKLADARRKSRLTQQQVAGRLRVSVTSLVNWESGKHVPLMRYQKLLERLYGFEPGKIKYPDTGAATQPELW